LTGNSDFESLIVPTFVEHVSLLPAGPIPPNPAELLDADRFRDLIASLRASHKYDHVIFDSPPVLSVVDPLLIGRQVEGTVLVIKSAFTSRDSGRLGKEKLLTGRVTLLGVLLNAVPTEHVPYQYRYYRYGYARKTGKKSEAAPAAAAGAGGGAGQA
jgi:capsular exopolysaccharide synthesis family protein